MAVLRTLTHQGTKAASALMNHMIILHCNHIDFSYYKGGQTCLRYKLVSLICQSVEVTYVIGVTVEVTYLICITVEVT